MHGGSWHHRLTWKRLLNPLLTVSLTPSICTGNSSVEERCCYIPNPPLLSSQPQLSAETHVSQNIPPQEETA